MNGPRFRGQLGPYLEDFSSVSSQLRLIDQRVDVEQRSAMAKGERYYMTATRLFKFTSLWELKFWQGSFSKERGLAPALNLPPLTPLFTLVSRFLTYGLVNNYNQHHLLTLYVEIRLERKPSPVSSYKN